MAKRKWKETKHQPGTAGPGNMLHCCLVSFHFLWAILCLHPVQDKTPKKYQEDVNTVPTSRCYGTYHAIDAREIIIISTLCRLTLERNLRKTAAAGREREKVRLNANKGVFE